MHHVSDRVFFSTNFDDSNPRVDRIMAQVISCIVRQPRSLTDRYHLREACCRQGQGRGSEHLVGNTDARTGKSASIRPSTLKAPLMSGDTRRTLNIFLQVIMKYMYVSIFYRYKPSRH